MIFRHETDLFTCLVTFQLCIKTATGSLYIVVVSTVSLCLTTLTGESVCWVYSQYIPVPRQCGRCDHGSLNMIRSTFPTSQTRTGSRSFTTPFLVSKYLGLGLLFLSGNSLGFSWCFNAPSSLQTHQTTTKFSPVSVVSYFSTNRPTSSPAKSVATSHRIKQKIQSFTSKT